MRRCLIPFRGQEPECPMASPTLQPWRAPVASLRCPSPWHGAAGAVHWCPRFRSWGGAGWPGSGTFGEARIWGGGSVPSSSLQGVLLHQQHPDLSPRGAGHHRPSARAGSAPERGRAAQLCRRLTPASLPPLPQTILSTSPRSPFSPATTPAAASGSRTLCSWWCRLSGRSWPRSTDTDVPGSGSAGKEQPGDGFWPPRITFKPWLLRQRDRARGGRRRGGLVLPARSSPGSCRRVKLPSSHGHRARASHRER